MTEQDKLRANAQLAIDTLGPQSGIPNFGYNRESVSFVADYIERERSRPNVTPEQAEGLINVLGSFLGEAIIHCYGGTWECKEEDGTWGVCFSKGNAAYPFSKIRKQMDNGLGDSILSFFTAIGPIFFQKKKRKPWWRFW